MAGILPLTTDGSTNHSGYGDSHQGEHQLLILSSSGTIPTYFLISFRLICAAGYKFYLITPGVTWYVLIFHSSPIFCFCSKKITAEFVPMGFLEQDGCWPRCQGVCSSPFVIKHSFHGRMLPEVIAHTQGQSKIHSVNLQMLFEKLKRLSHNLALWPALSFVFICFHCN